ncbi:hypothetical protein [Bradyrhizobium sp. CCBAU 53421]|uniref:hypothetical protein n=1 Tax=Bradyrhizobium sp. CCBAU 53421 TaxID=1325120 RepID=UPI00188ACA84|nr:hypothetical protein [Bradyrhizobium sp. CCBAU 53421]QOZ36262.1 hypothetical protein XH92_35155 [Bradyrhizobium sp. CCBAU 53421]
MFVDTSCDCDDSVARLRRPAFKEKPDEQPSDLLPGAERRVIAGAGNRWDCLTGYADDGLAPIDSSLPVVTGYVL